MARIRTHKPEFWTDARVVKLTCWARLFFLALLNFVDDFGRAEYDPDSLKLRIFPADDVDVVPLFNELVAQGMVRMYEVEGRKYFCIVNFSKHQKIDKRSDSRFPAPPETQAQVAAAPQFPPNSPESPRVPPNAAEAPLRKGMEKEGRGNLSPRAARSEADPRFKPFVDAVSEYWLKKNGSLPLTFAGAEGQQLNCLLHDNPKLTLEIFQRCLQHRASSDEVHSEPPRVWLSSVLKYANGPLDRYRKPKSKASGPALATIPPNPLHIMEKQLGRKL